MKPALLFLLLPLFLFEVVSADNKIHTLEHTGDYAIVVNEDEWNVQKGFSTVRYHNRDQSVIRGESTFLPMDFEFFSLFIPTQFFFAKNYLNIYAYNTKTVFSIVKVTEGCGPIQISGTFLDNMSTGYFQLTIIPDRRRNGRAFGMMAKLRFDLVSEERRNELFEEIASMVTPLVN